jgi:hypothetical protein
MTLEDSSHTEKMKNKSINENYVEKRTEYIKILNKLVHKLQFRSQTFYITCYYFDIILRNDNEIRIENAAIGSLLLASKFDEIDSMMPGIFNFQSFGKSFFTIEELRRSEFSCLLSLEYKLNHFTPYHFINFLFTIGIVFEDEELISNGSNLKPTTINLKLAEKIYDMTKEVLLYFIEGTTIVNTIR